VLSSGAAQAFLPFCASRNPSILKPFARSPAFLLSFIEDLAHIKQTARRRRRYVAMPSSSSSAASTPLVEPSSEDTFSDLVAVELHPGHTVEFGVSRISSSRVQDMQQFGYFGSGVGRVPGAEEIPSRRVSWWCSRHFLLLASGYLRIILWRRCCRGMKCRFIS
jgi:hypothetical protein